MQRQQEVMSMADVGNLIRNKEHFHKALIENGFFVPLFKASICTGEFLSEIKQKTCFCPLIVDVKYHGCPNPPSASVLQDTIK